ncbi:Calcineurin-binding protein cabin-1 [Lamellibrachia satsuma]|nr:Calcineurin-binding protein cabin-1 [Lamellibrachia satsuma]
MIRSLVQQVGMIRSLVQQVGMIRSLVQQVGMIRSLVQQVGMIRSLVQQVGMIRSLVQQVGMIRSLVQQVGMIRSLVQQTGDYLKGVGSDGESNEASGLEVDLPNCKTGQHITLEEVRKQLDSLHRCQSLEEVQKLHEAGDHEQVVELLLSAQQKNKGVPGVLPERPAQLLLLQDSLLKLNDYKRCLLWGEVAFEEGLRHYSGATSSAMQDDWTSMIVELLQGLNTILLKDMTIISELPSKNLVRLTTNLIQVIQINMATPLLFNLHAN